MQLNTSIKTVLKSIHNKAWSLLEIIENLASQITDGC